MTVKLTILRPGEAVEVLELSVGVIEVGREFGELRLVDPRVSARHGELHWDGAVLTYVDIGSTNGSLLDGFEGRLPTNTKTPLADGARLRLGSCEIAVSITQPAAAPPARAFASTMVAASGPAVPAHVPSASPMPGPAAPVPRAVQPSPAAGQGVWDVAGSESYAGGEDRSRPFDSVRHAYPLSITDASLSTALGLMGKTMPYAIARFVAMGVYSLLSIVWFVVTFGGMAMLARITPLLGYIWMFAGLFAGGFFWRTLLRYTLYLLKAGHIAVLTELITEGHVNNGQTNMFEYGKTVVKARFGEVNAMFGLDLLIHGIVRALNRTLNWVANLLPIPGLDGVMGIINRLLGATTTYIDETLFSYNLARRDDNVFRSSKDGLIYYAQNAQEVLKTGAFIVLLDYAASVVGWLLMLGPAALIAWVMPSVLAGPGSLLTLFVATIFLANVRAAFIRPLFLIMVMIKFHVCVRNQPINESWDERLGSVSSAFGRLKDKAVGHHSDRPSAQQPAGAVL